MTAAPVRLQLSRRKGFDLQALSRAANGLEAVNVARPGPWGNPFVVGVDGTASYCVDLYKAVLSGLIALTTKADVDAQKRCLDVAHKRLHELRGKNLACWCRAGKPCHADVLLELANR